MMSRTALSIAALALLASAPALAADNGIYLGAALAQSDSGISNGTLNYSDSHSGYKIFAGVRPIDSLAIEASYADFGSGSGSATASSTSSSAYALLIAPITLLDVYGKVGMSRWQTDLSTPAGGSRLSGTDLAWGGGIGLHFTSLGARLEYERVQNGGGPNLSMISLGLSYTFL